MFGGPRRRAACRRRADFRVGGRRSLGSCSKRGVLSEDDCQALLDPTAVLPRLRIDAGFRGFIRRCELEYDLQNSNFSELTYLGSNFSMRIVSFHVLACWYAIRPGLETEAAYTNVLAMKSAHRIHCPGCARMGDIATCCNRSRKERRGKRRLGATNTRR